MHGVNQKLGSDKREEKKNQHKTPRNEVDDEP
jgi:hypothetical protein